MHKDLHACSNPYANRAEVERQYPHATVHPMPDAGAITQAVPAQDSELRRLTAVAYANDHDADRTEAPTWRWQTRIAPWPATAYLHRVSATINKLKQ